MARKRKLHKYLPTPEKLKEKKHFQFLGEHLFASDLWHLNRRSASVSGFIGAFFAMMPIPGQTLAAAIFALVARSNLPLAISLVWITNPLTLVPVFYGNYLLGCWLTGTEVLVYEMQANKEWVMQNLTGAEIWIPLGIGCLAAGLSLGLIFYFGISQLWRWHVVRRWQQRKHRSENAVQQDAQGQYPAENGQKGE